MGNMGSAHPLVEVNVSFKFEGNPSISKGVIERTRIRDGPTDRRTDRPTRQSESSIAPPTFCGGGIIKLLCSRYNLVFTFDIHNIRERVKVTWFPNHMNCCDSWTFMAKLN